MKKFFIIVTSVLLSVNSFAQFTTLNTSKSFAEPQNGAAKILKTSAGNTLFLHFEKKGTLHIQNYDATKNLLFEKKIAYLTDDERFSEITAAFTTGDQLVCFINKLVNKTPVLTRMIINSNTGQVIENEVIAKLDKIDLGSKFAMGYGGVPAPSFYIRKDENSNNYAIASFNTLTSNRNERIQISHYNEKNQAISSTFYKSPDNDYKFMTFLDLYVDGDKAIYVVTKGMNTSKSGGDQNGALFIGKLDKGANNLELLKVNYKNAKKIEAGFLRFNPATEKFMLLTNQKTGPTMFTFNTYYEINFASFDKDLTDFTNKPIEFKTLDHIAKTQFKKKEALNAIPQALYINQDGSYTIVLEELLTIVRQSNSSTTTTYFLNDIGVIKYDKNDQIIATNYIPKSHLIKEVPSTIQYSFRDEIAYNLSWGTQYKSFHYLDIPGKSYILFNDIAQNQEKMKKGNKITTIQTLTDCEGYYYPINSSGIPEGQKVISDKGNKDKNLILFAIAHYDKKSNEYIILNRQLDGKKKTAALVWLKPE